MFTVLKVCYFDISTLAYSFVSILTLDNDAINVSKSILISREKKKNKQ